MCNVVCLIASREVESVFVLLTYLRCTLRFGIVLTNNQPSVLKTQEVRTDPCGVSYTMADS